VTNAMDRLMSCTSLLLEFCFIVRFVVEGGIVVTAGEEEKAEAVFFGWEEGNEVGRMRRWEAVLKMR
jgi:hypothetical protein